MEDILKDIRRKLKNKSYKNEEHVRLSLISRILLELGWNIWNPKNVFTEFPVAPNEDNTRVDIALFVNQYTYAPSVFIEIKSVGKVTTELRKIERQLRNYNRNNTATFTVLTDGRKWRFYYSQTGGEFSRKCFKTVDLIENDYSEIEKTFSIFLSKSEIESENAKDKAQNYLQLNQKQRALEDAYPKAIELANKAPFPSIPKALLNIVSSAGFKISNKEVENFIENSSPKNIESKFQPKKSNFKTKNTSATDSLSRNRGSHPIDKRKAHTNQTHSRSSKTVLRVTMDNGSVIEKRTAAQTMTDTIAELGLKKVADLNYKVSGVDLVSKSEHSKYNQTKIGEFYICTHSNTKSKKNLLSKIANELGQKITVEIVDS